MIDHFFLSPQSVPLLAKVIQSLLVLFYMLFFAKTENSLRWFKIYLIGYAGLDIFAFFGQTWYGPFHHYHLSIQYFFAILLSFAYFRFALDFNQKSNNSENKLTGHISTAIVAISYIILATNLPINESQIRDIQKLLGVPILFFFGATYIFGNRYRIARNQTHAENHPPRAYLTFCLLTIGAILLSATIVLRNKGSISSETNALLFFSGNLVLFSVLIVAIQRYLYIKASISVKLVGLSVVLFLLVIGLQGILIFPYNEMNSIFTGAENLSRIQIAETFRAELTHLHNQALPLVGFLIGGSVFVLLFFPVAFRYALLIPIQTLLKGIERVNQGDLKHHIPVNNRDEIGRLTSSFNSMTESLQDANKHLLEYANTLEHQISERTERLTEANEELRTANDALKEQTHKLEMAEQIRTNLFTNISHELRTPVTLIQAPLKISMQNKLPENVEKQLSYAVRNTQKLLSLVDQIFDLNRMESGNIHVEKNVINIGEYIHKITSSFESLFVTRQIRLIIEQPHHPVFAHVDTDMFEKMIYNLLSNAAKFTFPGGFVRLVLREFDETILICVSDNGIGISQEKISQVFNRFETRGKEHYSFREGLGIGLAITKEYIKMHDGSVKVFSEEGIGSAFQVYLPKGKVPLNIPKSEHREPKVELSVAAGNKNTEQELIEPTRETIVLVEDNYEVAEYVLRLLREEGFNMYHFENGQVALKSLPKINPSLIISDIMMPKMDGFEFLKELRSIEIFKSTPTIFLSALNEIHNKLEGLRLGINDYLVKPFDPTELICRIENLLEFSQARQEVIVELSEVEMGDESASLIPKLTTAIESRISDSYLTVDQLAPDIGLSRSSLYREIKRLTGFTAASFVREIRLQKARQILETSTMGKGSELCYKVGFQSPSYFNRMYKKRFGKSPSDYIVEKNY